MNPLPFIILFPATLYAQTLTLINESRDTIEVDIYENEKYYGFAKIRPNAESIPIQLSLFSEYRVSAREINGTTWEKKNQVFTVRDFVAHPFIFRITYHNINKA